MNLTEVGYSLTEAILNSPEGIIVFALDSNYRYIYFSPTHKEIMKSLWGSDIELGNRMLDFIVNEKDRSRARSNFDKALSGERLILEEAYGDEKFKRAYYENRYSPVFGTNGNIIGLSVYVVDITHIKVTEHALQESESHLQTLFDTMTEGVALKEPVYNQRGEMVDTKVLKVNNAYRNMFGNPSLRIIGALGSKLYNISANDVKEFWRRHLENDAVTAQELPDPIGGRYYLVTASPLRNGTIVSSFLDITERKNSERRLREAFIEIKNLKDQLQHENTYLREEISLQNNYEQLVFSGDTFRKVLTQVEQVASLDATVLIMGETGTGKELVARAIHNLSKRKDKPLIKVNCGALPNDLVESELFGYEKGAFTGAMKSKPGKFELANGGTLFLDEIGEMPLDLQVKLLRAIQEGEFERLGATTTTRVDVRIIAATNKDLQKLSETGEFRQDLFFRLNVFPVTMPTLRERVEDIPVLVRHFVKKYMTKHEKEIGYISNDFLIQLKNYQWPGNVRELENIIERAVILSEDEQLMTIDLVQNDSSIDSGRMSLDQELGLTLDDVQRNHILKVLTATGWRIDGVDGAAQKLNMKPSTLRDRMKKLGVKRPKLL